MILERRHIVLLLIIVLLIVGGGGVYLYKKSEVPSLVGTGTSPANSSEPCTRNGSMGTYKCDPLTTSWKTYSNASLSFQYPSLLSLKQDGETVILDHSIAYKHYDFGDMKGDGPPLERFTDFSISFKVFNKNLKELVQSSSYPGWDYVSKNAFKFGSFEGFRITEGVEGSGKDVYYFSISSNKTLVIDRALIPELTPFNGEYQTYLNLPGIIPPVQAEEFFTKILSSLKVN